MRPAENELFKFYGSRPTILPGNNSEIILKKMSGFDEGGIDKIQ
jgi:hypothetical protein